MKKFYWVLLFHTLFILPQAWASSAFLEASATTISAGEPVTFDATSSFPSYGEISGYSFDFGDGTQSGWITSPIAEHSYQEAGTFSARVKVRDKLDVEQEGDSGWSSPVVIIVEEIQEPLSLTLEADPPEILAGGEETAITIILTRGGVEVEAIEDTFIFLSTTPGTITPEATIPQGESRAKAVLTSSSAGGTAYVEAFAKGIEIGTIEVEILEKETPPPTPEPPITPPATEPTPPPTEPVTPAPTPPETPPPTHAPPEEGYPDPFTTAVVSLGTGTGILAYARRARYFKIGIELEIEKHELSFDEEDAVEGSAEVKEKEETAPGEKSSIEEFDMLGDEVSGILTGGKRFRMLNFLAGPNRLKNHNIRDKIKEHSSINIVDLLLRTWKKARDLKGYRDTKKYPCEKTYQLDLLTKTIRADTKFTLYLLLNGKRILGVPFDMDINLKAEGFKTWVKCGRIMKIISGTTYGSIVVLARDFKVVEKNIDEMDIPGEISFEEGIEIP
jgi:hypothetical protein